MKLPKFLSGTFLNANIIWGMTAWLAFASLTGEARWGWIGLLTGVIPATYILYATRNINQIKSQEVNNGKRI